MKSARVEDGELGREAESGETGTTGPVPTTSRRRLHELLNGRRSDSGLGRVINNALVVLIAANVAAVIVESNAAANRQTLWGFHLFEVISVMIFSLEYLARVWVAPEREPDSGLPDWRARLRYARSPLALVDLLAIAPFYISMFLPIDLRYLRAFRLLRLLKLTRYFDGLQIFIKVIRGEAGAIAAALLTIFVLIIISACLMFSLEHEAQPEAFATVIDAIWWAVVTLTTVGYGDLTPVTVGGKVLAICIMLLGVAAFALPAGILAARFSEELQERREQLRKEVAEALSDGLLDEEERADLDRLQAELGLPPETLQRLLELQGAGAPCRYCPRCGERLPGPRTAPH